MGKILIVDQDAAFLGRLAQRIKALYPLLELETCGDAPCALRLLGAHQVDLLLMDLDMPVPEGGELFDSAVKLGMDKNRIVILSARDSDYLHERFPMGTCLAVLNKFEAKQKAVLDMIFSSMERKAAVQRQH